MVRIVELKSRPRKVVRAARPIRRSARVDPITGAVNTAISGLSNPGMLAAVMVCLYLALTHKQDPATSLVKKFADWLLTIDAMKWLGTFLNAHLTQSVGAACNMITAYITAPRSQTVMWTALGAAVAFVVPERNIYEYLFLALSFALYLKARNSQGRVGILVFAGAVWLLFFSK